MSILRVSSGAKLPLSSLISATLLKCNNLSVELGEGQLGPKWEVGAYTQILLQQIRSSELFYLSTSNRPLHKIYFLIPVQLEAENIHVQESTRKQ